MEEEKVTTMNEETPGELNESLPMDEAPVQEPPRKGMLRCKCACGNVSNISDEVIEDGISWTMIVGNDHYLTLHCEVCGSELTMFIEEIQKEDALPQESNKE